MCVCACVRECVCVSHEVHNRLFFFLPETDIRSLCVKSMLPSNCPMSGFFPFCRGIASQDLMVGHNISLSIYTRNVLTLMGYQRK